MYPILSSKKLAPNIFEFVVKAPLVAKNAKAGQFVIVRTHEKGERIPLTIADFDPQKGTVTIVFQVVGKTTDELSTFKEGDSLRDFVGPLGTPSEIEFFGKVLVVGGGVGIAPIFPIAKALKEAGNEVIGIIGARSADLLFWEEKVKSVCDRLIICTDDGSKGLKGFVTQAMEEVFKENGDIKRCWAIGPLIMMKFATQVAKKYNIPIIVSLNPIMVDGTGMCGACRCTVGGKTVFACSHGPEFDGTLVDFDELIKRGERFKEEEKLAWERYKAMKEGKTNVQD
ncbi:MAG: sulfide/dihydroorotate dehydrogenase-like FAD/NAD-binding protein [Synergistetes bacterium]|nr:MAG: 2-polyprenylphenol hydroxylase and related flavodoxin oxidoreductase [bacterium 42_11]MBC7332333.1 sulfide/dihydroorotate dehydrogenase-like FAD/NAD-binding protein [Synergistota bacterium]MDK2871701.1 ferredoxin/flavodoxin---NADP+ reductase [bacterium]